MSSKNIFYLAILVAALIAVTAAQAAEYTIDPVHSIALYRIKHAKASYSHGVFTDISGNFSFDPAKPEEASVEVTVKTASINSFHPVRDEHLRGPDFFDVEKYPEMVFRSTSWKKTAENRYAITGKFTLRGVTREVTLEAELVGIGKGMKGETLAGFETVFTIQRREFGMDKYLPDALSDEVQITVSLEGAQE